MANTPGYFNILLPTKPYLRKYIQSTYGSALNAPVIFSSSNTFGMVLAICLEKKVMRDRSVKEIRCRFDRLTDTIPLYFPVSWLRNYYHGTDFTNEKVLFINKLLENQFEEDLYRYCFVLDLVNIQRKKALEDFCGMHGIEMDVDITYENLKQTEYRYREKKDKKNPLELSPKTNPKENIFFTQLNTL